MIRHRAGHPLAGVFVNVRRLTLTALVIAVPVAITSPPASASAVAQGSWAPAMANGHGPVGSDNGNGKYNQTYVAVNSPTNLSGEQVVSISISRNTLTQQALCKKNHFCKIHQKAWIHHRR